MIQGRCDAQGKWPLSFAAIPEIGNFVQGKDKEGGIVRMKVSNITHDEVEVEDAAMRRRYNKPFIIVHLEDI